MNTTVDRGGGVSLTALLFIQGDGTLLVQSEHPSYHEARPMLLSFAEMIQRLDPIHVYRVRPVTLWQSASMALSARQILTFLRGYAAHPVPYALQQLIVSEVGKWGKLSLQRGGRNRIALRGDHEILTQLGRHESIQALALDIQPEGIIFNVRHRADVKRAVVGIGYPVLDKAGYQAAPSVPIRLKSYVELRDYQEKAVEHFYQHARDQSGVIVLPCGSGKTIVGLGILSRLQLHALILTPSESSALQWQREILDKTSLTGDDVALYQPGNPLTPITITTYQRVTAKTRAGERKHLRALTSYPWGIVIYDEVHMLPAPLFRLAADLQSARRLGLTATLVREDGADADVFSLIGAKCYEVPWKQLEQQGYLAAVRCVELRIPLGTAEITRYEAATAREKHRIAALNAKKIAFVEALTAKHRGESIMIIGHYLDSLHQIAERLDCPLVTGQTPQGDRDLAFEHFRNRVTRCIVLSRVANMAIDLPCASVAIQVSGLFGSRQEEAQRLGRLLRPDTVEAVFYSLISKDTVEERMAKHRQMYLVEQGYAYDTVYAEEGAPDLALDPERMTGNEAVGMPEHR